jgi:hypothetical protein
MRALILLLLSCAVLGASVPAAASDHDIHFLSEHVPESAMDAHYLSLPWPAGHLEPGEWQQSFDLSTANTRTDFIEIDGPMVAFAASSGVTETSGYEVLGFYSDMKISGSGRSVLDPFFLRGVPLDLPQPADFTNARGTFDHFGVGAAYVRSGARHKPDHAPQFIVGALLERAEISGYAFDYLLVAGADAGASGVLDHSSRATYVTPFIGWQQTRQISARWSWSPRAMLMHPLPPGALDARLTGPGFDLATPRDGNALEFGDPFVSLGVALAHMPSGLEIDLGSTAFFPSAEHVSHAGVDHAYVVHVAWRRHPHQRSD